MAKNKDLIAEDGELFQTHIGGAALLEGIMMRGKYNWAVAVRTPEGEIYTEEHPLPHADKPQAWKKWPLVRGSIALFESLALSMKAMEISAEHAFDFEEDERQQQLKKALKKANREAMKKGTPLTRQHSPDILMRSIRLKKQASLKKRAARALRALSLGSLC